MKELPEPEHHAELPASTGEGFESPTAQPQIGENHASRLGLGLPKVATIEGHRVEPLKPPPPLGVLVGERKAGVHRLDDSGFRAKIARQSRVAGGNSRDGGDRFADSEGHGAIPR